MYLFCGCNKICRFNKKTWSKRLSVIGCYKKMVFCLQNWSCLPWEKNDLVIKIKFLQLFRGWRLNFFLDHQINLFNSKRSIQFLKKIIQSQKPTWTVRKGWLFRLGNKHVCNPWNESTYHTYIFLFGSYWILKKESNNIC